MASYIVMEPPSPAEAGDARLVRDGFSLLALLFAPFWLAWHRLWLAALVVFAAQLLLTAVGEAMGLPFPATLLSLLVSLYVGLEAPLLLAAGLRRRGFVDAGVVVADSRADADARYANALASGEPSSPSPRVPRASTSTASGSEAPALGLLGYSGR